MKKALIVQGGGFRTAFGAGVLDAFIEKNYNPFDIYAGISAGSIALSYYLSNQQGFCIDAMNFLSDNDRLINYSNVFKAMPIMNVDVFRDISEIHQPFNIDTALEQISQKKLAIVMTNKLTGKPCYHYPDRHSWRDAVIASCSIPFVSKGQQMIEGVPFMDGDWSDPLPIKWAIENGAREITIVQTLPSDERKKFSITDRVGSWFYWRKKELKMAFRTNHLIYNEALDISINNKDVRFNIIAPEMPLKAKVYTNSKSIIKHDYDNGIGCGRNFLRNYKN
ncbi:MAG: patatin family protein [Flavobacteriales bacterium]|nr:patatin family protein [Flavobacteriales bacterium]